MNNLISRLRWFPFIVGLASIGWMIYYVFAHAESGFSLYSVPSVLILTLPLTAGVIIAWKRPLTGGIVLVVFGLLWTLHSYVVLYSMANGNPQFQPVFNIFESWSLPYIIPGIIFISSRYVFKTSSINHQPVSKMLLSGAVIITSAGLFVFGYEIYRGTNVILMSGYTYILEALIFGSSLVLLAAATLTYRFWGGVLGILYALLMLTYFLVTQTADRTLFEMISQLKYDIIPVLVVLAGSVVILIPSTRKAR